MNQTYTLTTANRPKMNVFIYILIFDNNNNGKNNRAGISLPTLNSRAYATMSMYLSSYYFYYTDIHTNYRLGRLHS